jgi:protein translocase SecG subunit
MFSVIAIIIILLAIALIAVVLLQPGKGDLSASFGGLGGQFGSMFGMQKTMGILAKTTRVLAIVILVLVLLVNKFFVSQDMQEERKVVTEGVKPTSGNIAPPPVSAPGVQQDEAPAQQPEQEKK